MAQESCTAIVQIIRQLNFNFANNYAEVYFFKVKVLLAKKVRKMNLFLNPFFAQRRLYLIQFWLAEHPWRTAAQSFAYAHLESTNRYVCAALKVGRLTSFAMNIDSFIIQLRCTIHSLMVNAYRHWLFPIAFGDRWSMQSRTHSKSWIAWNFRAHPPVIISLKLIVW